MGKLQRKKKTSNRPKTRKELRKESRKLKKKKRSDYYTNRKKHESKVSTDDSVKEPVKSKDIKKEVPKEEDWNKALENEKRKEKRLREEMRVRRKKQLKEANAEEDRNIRRLEKQLKLNKRKSKSMPKSFVADGLDYLLEICDEDKKNIILAEQQFNELNDDFEEDFELMTGKGIKKRKIQEKKASVSDNDEISGSQEETIENQEEEEDIEEQEEDEIDDQAEEEEIDDQEEEEEIENHEEEVEDESEDDSASENVNINEESDDESSNDSKINKETEAEGTWEDIYGRLRNKDGSLIQQQIVKYVPPALRKESDPKRKEKLDRLKKQLKGLLNRLAEANMHGISNQIEDLYMNNSRNDMNETITNLMLESLGSSVPTPERLLLEHVMLITILHANVGTEIGAHFLQQLITHYDRLFNTPQEVEDKTLDNIINIISQLYNFKVFDSRLLYDILSKLSKKFDEKSVECILSILKNVGFSLRKDDPIALKSLILELQKQASKASEETKDNPRVRFMLDILLAIKNNNVSKIPNYDTTYSEHLKKILKSFIRKGNYVTQLKISLDDLLKAETHGKWWIVGSAWTGANLENTKIEGLKKPEGFSQKLLDLAKKQHMNTDTRRSVFCVIMSAEDYLDAFEKLLKLGLKNQQEREIINVILHCCLQEKSYNPYYGVLSQKFCDHDRKFQMIIKFAIWDKLKALTECSASQLSNLAKLLTHLFMEQGLPLSTLKVIQFAELDKTTLRLLRQVLLGILTSEDDEACLRVFQKVSHSEKLKMFRESLRLFLHHFLLKNLSSNSIPEGQKSVLRERVDVIEKLFSSSDKKIR